MLTTDLRTSQSTQSCEPILSKYHCLSLPFSLLFLISRHTYIPTPTLMVLFLWRTLATTTGFLLRNLPEISLSSGDRSSRNLCWDSQGGLRPSGFRHQRTPDPGLTLPPHTHFLLQTALGGNSQHQTHPFTQGNREVQGLAQGGSRLQIALFDSKDRVQSLGQ